jgi:tRNA(fMet)-specific endonuclease VapC
VPSQSSQLYTGVEKCNDPVRERQKVDRLVRTVSHVDFNLNHAGAAAEVRAKLESRGTPIGPYDILLAGQAIAAGLTLVTANVAEFKRVDGLSIVNWQD